MVAVALSRRAAGMAKELGMGFRIKLAWGDFSPVKDVERIRNWFGAASREEYLKRTGEEYLSGLCHQLWDEPQINSDGKVLGCCRNFWGKASLVHGCGRWLFAFYACTAQARYARALRPFLAFGREHPAAVAYEYCRLMVMMTDWTVDRVGADSRCGSLSFCGSRDTDYPDSRPMGYPFDRRPAGGLTITQMLAHPSLRHVAATTVGIRTM